MLCFHRRERHGSISANMQKEWPVFESQPGDFLHMLALSPALTCSSKNMTVVLVQTMDDYTKNDIRPQVYG